MDSLQSNTKHGTFEWIESILCKALKEGAWLLIDNVNLCSASVLDRLVHFIIRFFWRYPSKSPFLSSLSSDVDVSGSTKVFLRFRLNALFEQGGRLTVSERGVLDGQVPEIKPHPGRANVLLSALGGYQNLKSVYIPDCISFMTILII